MDGGRQMVVGGDGGCWVLMGGNAGDCGDGGGWWECWYRHK